MPASVNPDVYLLYEYSPKTSFTVRMKFILDEAIDEALLTEAAQEAIGRFPYFAVRVGLDEGQNFTLEHNDEPLPVLPEQDQYVNLGGTQTNGHLVAITWRDNAVWFNYSHSLCGASGALFWIKTTLYQYMTKKYGPLDPPSDLKMVGTPVTDEEIAYPNADDLPTDEPIVRYTGSKSGVGLMRMIKFMRDPTTREKFYYEIEIPAGEFMTYAKSIDGSPNTVLSALMIKAIARYYDEVEGDHISMCIADDYHKDVGVPGSYRDFVRFIHVMYDWSAKDASVKSLSMTARGAIMTQALPELSYERVRSIEEIRKGIDAQPDLESKKQYATANSLYRMDYIDTGTLSYVGQVDYGQMGEHIKGIYTITDGDMMIELNALPNTFYLALQMVNDEPDLTEVFCDVLREEGLQFTISACKKRGLPTIQLPEA